MDAETEQVSSEFPMMRAPSQKSPVGGDAEFLGRFQRERDSRECGGNQKINRTSGRTPVAEVVRLRKLLIPRDSV